MLEKQGNLDNKPRGEYFKKIDPEKLAAYLEELPDAYLYEIAAIFNCSSAAVCKALKRLGYTHKKRPLPIKNKTSRRSKSTKIR